MFLTSLYNQGKGYSCINLTRSAVATLLFGSKISVGMHPLVKNLLEECLTEDQHSHGTQLRGTHILCLIFYKVVLLCLLLSGQRGQALWLLDLCNITWSKTDIRCTFESISSRFPLQTDIRTNLCLEAFLKINLCVWCTTCVTIRKELVL